MKRSFLFITFVVAITKLSAQELYMPRDINLAFKNQTRSVNGKPGKNYWQNKAKYNITITAMPPDRNISGSEQISYTNNSPDTLHVLRFKFIQNIHKPGATRQGGASADYLTDGVHVDKFTVNGVETKWENNDYSPTVQYAELAKPLMPHESVQLTFDWHFQASLKSGREGMIDSTTYFLAYFYPRVAVFDDYNGWDELEHTDALEFYNDFNDYVLNVKVPKNYLVWATGNLQNANDVLQQKYVDRLNESMKADAAINIVNAADLAAKNVTKQNALNTWTYTYNDITDVALGLSDHFVWDASSVIINEKTGQRASANAAYNDTAKDYHHVVHYVQGALSYLSTKWPGISYPFPKMTVFQGYAGMEYPMMANDETYEDTVFSRFVAQHEIAHTWFPFYMGINETRYGFMDEGWATTFELLYARTVMPKDVADRFYKRFRVNGWINDNNSAADLPIITPGDQLSGSALGNNEYGKPSLGYLAVKDLLGDDLFRKCLHGFMDRWHGKHPIPWDFFNSFNDISGKNLNWFWNAWFFSHGYIDLAIESIKPGREEVQLLIKNIGGFPVPVDIKLIYEDGSNEVFHRSPEIWATSLQQASVTIPGIKKPLQSAQLTTDIYVDADMSNNSWKK
ncbi:MAG: M1 family metallopeptidase [Ferruginibacter sp.]